jgi:hypothetical protein
VLLPVVECRAEMPALRHTSATGVPSSAWRKTNAICARELRLLHGTLRLPSSGS